MPHKGAEVGMPQQGSAHQSWPYLSRAATAMVVSDLMLDGQCGARLLSLPSFPAEDTNSTPLFDTDATAVCTLQTSSITACTTSVWLLSKP